MTGTLQAAFPALSRLLLSLGPGGIRGGACPRVWLQVGQGGEVLLNELGTVSNLLLYFRGESWEVEGEVRSAVRLGRGGQDVNGVEAGVRGPFGSVRLHDALKMPAERIHAVPGEAVSEEKGHRGLEQPLGVSVDDPGDWG